MTLEYSGIPYLIIEAKTSIFKSYKYCERVETYNFNKGELNMAFQVSPGVSVTEKDLTNVIPAVSTTSGGIVITAEKGPVDEITTISSEKELVDNFGKPTC